MTPRPKSANPKSMIVTLRLADDMFRELKVIQDTDGVPISEQVRRGIGLWLEAKGVKSERKRAGTRKRS